MNKKQLQFELWQECNNKCKFCYLGERNRDSTSEKKIEIINTVMNRIKNDSLYDEYDTIGFIGGEFFQGQLADEKVREKFNELMDLVISKMDKGFVQEVWLAATLTIGNQQDLFDTLERFGEHQDKVWVVTSYDTYGRFHTQKMKDTWHNTMMKLKTDYPKVRRNVTIIITGEFILSYLNDEFSFEEFYKNYENALFLKHTCVIGSKYYMTKLETNEQIGYFFPKRQHMLDFMIKLRSEDPEVWHTFLSWELRADVIDNYSDIVNERIDLIREKADKTESCNNENFKIYVTDCGHQDNLRPYCDSDECIFCDKLTIENMI